jgi:hypothetical protein
MNQQWSAISETASSFEITSLLTVRLNAGVLAGDHLRSFSSPNFGLVEMTYIPARVFFCLARRYRRY